MYKFLSGLLVVAALTPFISYAALTDAQIQSVTSLVRAFGADEVTVKNVNQSLGGSVLGATVACPTLTVSLQRGMTDATTNGQVTELQKFFASYYGLSNIDTVTGYFGPVTYRTVLRFQTEQGISAIGIVGPQTRAKIASVCSGTTVQETTLTPKPGPICPAIAYIPAPCSGTLTPRYDTNGCQNGWTCTQNATSTLPTVTVTTDPSSPAFALAAAGTSVPLVAMRLTASGETVSLNTITVSLAEGVSWDLESVTLFKDGAPKATAFFVGSGTQAVFTLAGPIVIPKGEYVVFTVYGKLSPIGTGEPVTESGHKVRVEFKSLTGTGTTSLQPTAVQGGTQSAGVRVVKSFPTVSDVSSTLAPGGVADGRLMRFKITADPRGPIGLTQLFVQIAPVGAQVSNVNIYGYEDASFSTPISGVTSSGALRATDACPTGCTSNTLAHIGVTTSAGTLTAIQIPTGMTRYFEVRGTVTGIQSGASVTTKLVGDGAYAGPVSAVSLVGKDAYFIWSPNSTTTAVRSNQDWFTGFGVSGLPSTGISHTRTSTVTPPSTGCKLEITKTVDREDYKSSGTATITPNENLSYTIEFKNSGTTRCSLVKVQDVLDVHLTYVSETHSTNVTAGYLSLPTYQSTTRTVSFNAWDLDPSETGWVKIQTKVGTPSSCSVTVPNSAMITAYEYSNFSSWVYSSTASVTLKKDCPLPPSSITVTAPNGGEQWELGTMNTITWSPYGYNPDVNPARDVKAYLERKDGTNYVVVGTVIPSGKASIHWETDINTYGTYPAPGSYYIRVLNTVTGAWDRSDAPFNLLPKSVDLKLNGSDGPVAVDVTRPVTATWTATNVARCELHNLYTDATRATQVGAVPLSGTREVYTYGSAGPTLYCYRSDGGARYDSVQISALPSVASIRVQTPNGGEQVVVGNPHTIAWQAQNALNPSIALYRNDQWVKWIVKSLPGAQTSYTWTPTLDEAEAVAPWLGSVYKIYVTAEKSDGTGYVDDKSDGTFTFVSAPVKPPACPLVVYTPIVCSGTVVPTYDVNGCLTGLSCSTTTGGGESVRQVGGTGTQTQ